MPERFTRTVFPALLSGMLTAFLLIYSYRFYQVNSFKLALALAGAIVMAGTAAFLVARDKSAAGALLSGLALILLLPTVAGLPGVVFKGPYYNFPYELATDLIAITWGLCLILLVRGTAGLQRALVGPGIAFLFLSVGIAGQLTGIWNDRLPVFSRQALSFGNPNYGAGVCLMFLALYTAIGLPRRRKKGSWSWSSWQRWFSLFALASFLTILYTGSRAGLILGTGTLFGLITLNAFREKWGGDCFRKRPAMVTGASLGAAASLVVLLHLRRQDFSSLLSAAGWEGRLLPWKTAWDSFLAAPLFGHGLGSSYSLFFQFRPPDSRLYSASSNYNHVHNEHLQMLQESGSIGYLLIILPCLALVLLLLRKWFRSPSGSPVGRLALGLAGGISLFYLHGLFSVAQRMILTNLPLYLMVAAAWVLLFSKKLADIPLRAGPSVSLAGACVAPVLATVLLVPWLHRQAVYHEALADFRESKAGDREEVFINKLKHSGDIYALHHALLACTQIADHQNGLAISEKIEELIPWYRNSPFMRATLLIAANRHDEAIQLLGEILERDRYSKNALPARAAYAALNSDFQTFTNDLRMAMKRSLLITPDYAHLQEEDVSIITDQPIPGLIEVIGSDHAVSLSVNPDWIANLYTVFGRRGRLSLQDRELTPLQYTRTLMAYSPYVQLPYQAGFEPTQEENEYWYERYRKYQGYRNELRQIRERMKYLSGRNTDSGPGPTPLKDKEQKIEEQLEDIKRRLAEVIDVRALDQRHQTFVNITEFVLTTQTFSDTIALARRMEDQAQPPSAD